MDSKVLFVDDDTMILEQMRSFFERRHWKVDNADDGREGLDILRSSAGEYCCIVLDLRMPVMGGEAMLKQLNKDGIRLPPIIVLSAFLDPECTLRCIELGATCILAKPLENKELFEIAKAVGGGTDELRRVQEKHPKLVAVIDSNGQSILVSITDVAAFVGPSGGEKDGEFISGDVARREEALQSYFLERTKESSMLFPEEPSLLVGRRWNSWYPSFFDADGGAYAVLCPRSGDGRLQAAVVDPGFSFLRILGGLGVSIRDMVSCIVTHNHPDHVGGVFEYIACRHVIGDHSTIQANPSVSRMLEDYGGAGLTITELKTEDVELLSSSQGRQLAVRGIETDHTEAGRSSSSLGLVISSTVRARGGAVENRAELIILGDTSYEPHRHQVRFVANLINYNVKVLVVHIGCSQLKFRHGKHLYLEGLQRLLRDVDSHLEYMNYNGKLLVLISEWGLEHATAEQIKGICGEDLAGFDAKSPIERAVRFLRNSLKKIVLLPADIGLLVGINSGLVYMKDGTGVLPSDISFGTDKEGLVYRAPLRHT